MRRHQRVCRPHSLLCTSLMPLGPGGFVAAKSGRIVRQFQRGRRVSGREAAHQRRGFALEPLAGAIMGAFRLLTVPIRRIANSRLFQLAIVVAIILLLDRNFSDYPRCWPDCRWPRQARRRATVQLISEYFHNWRTLTNPVLQDGVMIAYVYLVCLVAFALVRWLLRLVHSTSPAGATSYGSERRLRGNAVSLPTGPGCRSREYGRPITRRPYGKKSLRGPPVTGRPIRPSGREWCAARWATLPSLAAQPCCSSSSRRFRC